MHGITAALLTGMIGALGLTMAPASSSAPDPQAEIEACQARCDQDESETDRETCRLNCRQAVEEKDSAHIIRWTEERSVGGRVPGQDAAPPPTRTVTKVTPRGTVTETTAAPAPKAKPKTTSAGSDTTVLPSPRHRYYFGLVSCQEQCNPHKIGVERARCKLRCFRQHPGPPPPRTTPYATPKASTGKGKPKAGSKAAGPKAGPKATEPKTTEPALTNDEAWAACQSQCAGESSEDDRMTCEAQCWDAAKRKARSSQ